MKKVAKKTVAKILGGYVKKLRTKHDFKVVAVVGSIGKTSTKFAIARVLGEHYKVRFQEGNYNDIVSVPLVFFGLEMPSITNPAAWAKVFSSIQKKLKEPYSYEVVVVELGTDGPGQIAEFAQYLQVDIAVVTAITPEHMEFFASMDDVAAEELSVANFSKQLLVNTDLADSAYLQSIRQKVKTYGKNANDFTIENIDFSGETANFEVTHSHELAISAKMKAVSIAEIYSATAAAAVGELLGLSVQEIQKGITGLEPVSGRMQRLRGVKNSLIIDETYNASPVAVKAALDSLYVLDAPQKIAILGNMNELGHMSETAHREVGEYCDPKQLNLVVTIGLDANTYLASAAKKNGCKVRSFDSPYKAGDYVKSQLVQGAIIMAKGSQNGVFAEEALKLLLDNPKDASLLVRQSAEWIKKKQAQFMERA